MQTIRKDIVLAAMVRTFFKYFTTGVIEQTSAGKDDAYEPKNIKLQMLNHFEQIAHVFNTEAFYAIMRMNYNPDSMERLLREFVKPGITDMDMVRFACKTDAFYNIMVNEYKYNFEQLLNGRFITEPMRKDYDGCEEIGEMDMNLAEDIINRMTTGAYESGRRLANTNDKQ